MATTLERLAAILNEIHTRIRTAERYPTMVDDIEALTNDGLRVIGEAASQPAATVLENPAAQSSVEIETMAKGAPKVTVKVYAADPWQARQTAMQMYDATVKAYAAPAQES